jgi:NAD(P)-dependent dehydrogenase (short-subunit alcohol dehydrogenase family)
VELQISGHTAVVVGGANGIGRAIGAAFVEERSSVWLLDIDPAVQNAAAQMNASHEQRVRAVHVDATDFSAVQHVAAQIAAESTQDLHVVFAAGCGSGKYGFPFWNLTPSDWGRVLDVNLMGAVHTAHAFAPQWVAGRGGTLLLISSIAGQIGSQTDPPYSAAKAGIINFAQCAAKDLAPLGVRVNVISPGMVQTAVNKSVWRAWCEQQPAEERLSYEEWAGVKVKRVSPLGQWQTPEEIAAMAVFLASHHARNITGQTLNIDGGQVMHS